MGAAASLTVVELLSSLIGARTLALLSGPPVFPTRRHIDLLRPSGPLDPTNSGRGVSDRGGAREVPVSEAPVSLEG